MAKSDHSLMVKLVGQIDKSYQQTVNQIKKDSTAFERRNKVMMDGAKKWTRNVSLPLAAAVGYGVKETIQLQRGLAQISTIADTSTVSLESLSDGIKKIAMETGKDLADVTTAVYESISSGIDTKDSLAFVEKASKLAVGGSTDLATSVDVLTNIINGYGTSVKDTDHYMDVLFKTQDKGKVVIDELASNIGTIIATANMAGTSIDELGAMYSTMTIKGIDAAESTTAINNLLISMTKTGSKADKALREVSGKGFTELQKEGKSVVDILEMLNKHATGKGLTMANIFDQRGLKAANSLLADGAKEYNNLVGEMQNSGGTAQRAYDTMSETEAVRLEKLMQTLRVTAIEFGEAAMPIFTTVTSGIKDVLDWFNKLSPGAQNVITTLTLLAIGFGPLVQGILKTREAFLILKGLGMVAKFGKIKDVVKLAGGAMQITGGNAGGLLTAFGGLSAGMLAAGGIIAVLGVFIGLMMDAANQINRANGEIDAANRKMESLPVAQKYGFKPSADGTGTSNNVTHVQLVARSFEETYGSNPITKHYSGTKKSGSTKAWATGGIINRAHIGMVGEDGPEAIIPLSKPRRGREVLAQAASLLGATGSQRQSAVYNNSYTINIASNDPKAVAQEVKRTLLEIEREQRRRVLA